MLTVQFSLADLKRVGLRAIASIAVFAGVVGLAHCSSGCKYWEEAVNPDRELEKAYAAEISGCAATAKTLEESRKCRAGVNRRYGLCGHVEWPRVDGCED